MVPVVDVKSLVEERLTASGANSVADTAIAHKQKVSRICHFAKLPRELRDMIYSHVLRGTYTKVNPPRTLIFRAGCGYSRASQNLNILRTSRQVSEEAMCVLYRENYFRFYITAFFPPKPLCQKTADKVQKIHFVSHVLSIEDYSPADRDRILSRIQQLGILSNSCKVKDRCDFIMPWWRLPKEFLSTLETLSAFQCVTVKLGAEIFSRTRSAECFDRAITLSLPFHYELSDRLRPTLGCATFEGHWASFQMVFKPRGENPINCGSDDTLKSATAEAGSMGLDWLFNELEA